MSKLSVPIISKEQLKILASLDIFDYSLDYAVHPSYIVDKITLRVVAFWPSIEKGCIHSISAFNTFTDVLDDGKFFKAMFLITLKDLRSIIHGRYAFVIPLYDGPPRRKIRG